MKKLLKIGKLVFEKYWPIFLLTLIVLSIGFSNYQTGKWLIGWDSYTPNFNFSENFERNIFGIWQEDRGLGLPDGMSHIANLVHTFSIFLLSFFIPNNAIRFIYHLILYLLGGIGSYFLILKLTENKISSSIASIFFILNLAVMQMFHLPLAVFSVHFASLPWLTLLLLNLIEKSSFKNCMWFFVASFLATPQGYVPTIFGVYAILFLTILLFKFTPTKEYLKNVLLAGLLLFLSNAFWIIPYGFNLHKSLNTISDASINIMSNESIRLKNQEYGDLTSTIMGKGMYLSLYEQDVLPLMQPWIEHINKGEVIIISWIIFLVAIFGLALIIRTKNKKFYPFVALYIFSFLLLGNSIPFLSSFFDFINSYVPVFANAYRFIFTKFSILYMFNFSILFAVGLEFIFSKIKSSVTKNNLFLFFLTILIYLAKPSFQQNFFSKAMMVNIPEKYFQLQDFFENQPKSARVYILPQADFWGWTNYDWGFQGSGFIWQMLPQATMDGAFLPWSEKNESFYLELDQSLLSRDFESFDNTLTKYKIDWIVIDESIIKKEKKIDLNLIYETLNNSKVFVKEEEIDNIKIYRNINADQSSFIYVPKNLSFIKNDCLYCRKDNIFSPNTDYLSTKESINTPFQFLFSERNIEKNVSENKFSNLIEINSQLNIDSLSKYFVQLPKLSENKITSLPIEISKDQENIIISVYYPYQLSINNNEIFERKLIEIKKAINLEFAEHMIQFGEKQFIISNEYEKRLEYIDIDLNSPTLFKFYGIKDEVADGYIPTPELLESEEIDQKINIAVNDIETKKYKIKSSDKLIASVIPKEQRVDLKNSSITFNCGTKGLGEIGKNTNNNEIILSAKNKGAICDFYGLGNLSYKNGYLITFDGKNEKGKNLEFFVHNWITDQVDLEFTLNEGDFLQSFTLLTQENLAGNGYSINLKLNSFKYNDSQTILNSIRIFPLPIDEITKIKVIPENYSNKENDLEILSAKHNSPTSYKLEIKNQNTGYFSILQKFDKNWIAVAKDINKSKLDFSTYSFLPHYQLNNWANGWQVGAGEFVVRVYYWPQILTYLGFFILIFTGLFLIKNRSQITKINDKTIKHPIHHKTKNVFKGKI